MLENQTRLNVFPLESLVDQTWLLKVMSLHFIGYKITLEDSALSQNRMICTGVITFNIFIHFVN